MPTIKAIGPFAPDDPKSHPLDWILVRNESAAGELLLPYGTRVDLERVENNRDFFTIKDFEHAGVKASLGHRKEQAGYVSRLIAPLSYLGPAKIDWDASTGKATVSVPSDPTIKPITVAAISDPKVPDGKYEIRPKASSLGSGYVEKAPHAWSWWLIEYQPQRGFSFHPGRATLGCITCTELDKWESIWKVLVKCRSATGTHTGMIGVEGHSPYLEGTWESQDSSRRWKLIVNREGAATLIERNDRGTLTRNVTVSREGSRFRVERPNDPDVLRFLGAAGRELEDLLKIGPHASFLMVEKHDSSLSAEWNGIFWAFDDGRAGVRAFEQPGTTDRTSGRPYTLAPIAEGKCERNC